MDIVIAFVAGLFGGWVIAAIILRHKKAIGSLRVETSDPDGPYLFLELNDGNITELLRKRHVILNVKVGDRASQI